MSDKEAEGPAQPNRPATTRRLAVAALALGVVAAGIAFARAFSSRGSHTPAVSPSQPASPSTTPTPSAATPRTNGKIAFSAWKAPGLKTYDIYFIEPNGSHLAQLTSQFSEFLFVAWSPDGDRLAFVDGGHEFGPNEIYVINADGTGLTQITSGYFDTSPAWSPDGKLIAFARGSAGGTINYDIYVMRPDGTGLRNVTDDPVPELDPSWSPDGTRIAFEQQGKIYVTTADGSFRTVVTSGPYDYFPAWSPDGSRILFVEQTAFRISVTNSDGSEMDVVYECPKSCELTRPGWSPDGMNIVFSIVTNDSRSPSKLYVINADGSGLTRVPTGDLYILCCPSWQPLPG